MPTPAHTDLDSNNPQGSQTPANAMTSTLNNLRALRDAIVSGRLEGFVWSIAQGAGADLDHPQFVTSLNAALGIGFRWNITWTGHQLTTVTDEWSNDNGATWTAINTGQGNTYDASNRITASSQAGGWRTIVFQIWTQLLKIKADFATHTAATGTAVHGLGTVATQNANAIAFTGGSIDGVGIGGSSRASGNFTCVTVDAWGYTPGLNAAVTLDWSKNGAVITTNGSNALNAFINVPSGVADLYIEVDNPNNINNWATRFDFGAAGVPAGTTTTLIGCTTRNAAATKPRAWVIWQ